MLRSDYRDVAIQGLDRRGLVGRDGQGFDRRPTLDPELDRQRAAVHQADHFSRREVLRLLGAIGEPDVGRPRMPLPSLPGSPSAGS